MFDSIFKQDFAVFKVKDGENRVRFLPASWEDAEHYGLDIYVHYGIGSDNQSYLCLDKMKGEECPVCLERNRAEGGDEDYVRALTATKRVLCWVIDRDDEEAGPLLWPMAWTVDRDIATLCIDARSREALFIDDPEEGYDVTFTKTGAKLKTKYIGIKIDRRPSPLCDDADRAQEWLDFVADNPLKSVLQYFDAKRIAAAASGMKPAEDDEDEDDEDEARPTRSRQKSRPASTTRSRTTTSRSEDEDEDDEDYDCVACEDTGRNSKGGFCVCAKGRKLKRLAQEDEDAES
jgi:hypothetical protein